jgi:hypothetical protein
MIFFSSPAFEEEIFYDAMPPIYDDYNDDYVIFSPPSIEEKINCDYNMPPIFDDYGQYWKVLWNPNESPRIFGMVSLLWIDFF